MQTEEQTKTVTDNVTADVTTGKRIISVVSTRGERAEIEYEGNDWTGLSKLLAKGGTNVDGTKFPAYNMDSLKAVESINKGTLEHKDATIPTESFKLFLMPVKSKSGALTRKEAYDFIKSAVAKNPEAKAYFTKDGKNHTQLNAEVLNELIEKYEPGTSKKVGKEKAAAISDVVDSVKEAKSAASAIKLASGLSDAEKFDLVIGLLHQLFQSKGSSTSEGTSETNTDSGVSEKESKTEEAKETPEQEAKRKKKEEDDKAEEDRKAKAKAEENAKRKKKEEDDKELADMMGGMDSSVDKSQAPRRR